MIGNTKIFFVALLGAILSVVFSGPTGGGEHKCYCAAMNSTDTEDKVAERGLTLELPCDEAVEGKCKQLCYALANSTKLDPEGDDKFCQASAKDGLFNVHVYSKLCNRPYIFTGFIAEKPLCCRDKLSVPC